MSTLKENYHTNMTLAEAEKLVLKTLKQVMEEKISQDTVELCVIPTATKALEYRKADAINAILSSLE
jgi:20S proteasome subunit alpha 5